MWQAPAAPIERRAAAHQVVEVPPIKPDVTDYLLRSVACDGGKVTRAVYRPACREGCAGHD